MEREALKCAIQIPQHVAAWYASVEPQAFTAPVHAAVHEAMAAAGSPGAIADGREWIEAVLLMCPDDGLRTYVREFAVDPLHSSGDDDEQLREYGSAVIARLLEMDATRRIVELKGRLQRTNPTEQEAQYNRQFADLLALEQYRRQLRERALGDA